MARYFLHRFLLTLPALWLVLTMVFLLIHIVPGDPVEQMLGESAAPGPAAELRHTLGLDRPLIVQYGKYLWQVARGDFGQSFKFQAPVRRVIFERYPATLQLALLALLVCMAIAIPAGVLAAHRRGTAADRAIGVLTLFGLAVPNLALGPLLIALFSIELGWLPVSGRGGALNYILPAVTLGAVLAAILTRMVRGAMLEELSSDYARTARGFADECGGTEPVGRIFPRAGEGKPAGAYVLPRWGPACWTPTGNEILKRNLVQLLVSRTGVPRPRPSVRAALPLFMATSRNPLEPI